MNHLLSTIIKLLSIIFLMVYIDVSAQTKEDIESLRQETQQSIQEDGQNYQKFLDYYSKISLPDMLIFKIKAQLIRQEYGNAVKSLFSLKQMTDGNDPKILFQYHYMSFQVNQILGLKSEADENNRYIKKNYSNIDEDIILELAVDFSDINLFSKKEKIKILNSALISYNKKKNYFFAARSYYYLGNIYLSLDNPLKAEECYHKSYQIGLKNNLSSFSQAYAKLGLTRVYINQKKYKMAYDELIKFKKDAVSSPDLFFEREYYYDLVIASVYCKRKEELMWADRMLADSRQVFEDSKIKGRALLANRLENDYLQKVLEQKRFWTIMLNSCIVFFLALISGLFIVFKLRSKSHRNIKKESELKIFNIPNKTEKELLQKLDYYESSGKYTQKSISLKTLSQQLDTNPRYLSEIINKHKNTNFNTYINELRIDYISKKLRENPDYRKYKVSYLAEESGFSSHSLFTNVFKNKMGMSPIDYIQNLEKIN